MSDLHYCRLALPEGCDISANAAHTQLALNEVLTAMYEIGTDPATGQFRITYDLNSTLTRTSVLAEWRPNK